MAHARRARSSVSHGCAVALQDKEFGVLGHRGELSISNHPHYPPWRGTARW